MRPLDSLGLEALGAGARQAARGAAVVLTGQILRGVIQLSAMALLARILSPADFGLVAMVTAVTAFVTLFQDLGLSDATVQRQQLRHEEVSGLFWINVGAGILCTALAALLAPVIGWFFGDFRLVGVSLALAPSFVLNGVAVQHRALLRRFFRFRALAAIGVAADLAGSTLAVFLAFAGVGYWALVALPVASAATLAIASWSAMRWHPATPRAADFARQSVSFGRNVTTFNILNYFSRNLDNVLIGRLWGAGQLGFYDKAYSLLLLPVRMVNQPIATVAVPVLSRLAAEPVRYRKAYLRILEKIVLVSIPGLIFAAINADWVVRAVLGPQWSRSAPIFAWLALAGTAQAVANTTGWLFISQDRTRDLARWGVAGSLIVVISIVAGVHWGALGVAIAYSMTVFCIITPVLLWFVGRAGPVSTSDLLRGFRIGILPGAAVAATCMLTRALLKPENPLLGLGLSATLAAAATTCALVCTAAGRRALEDSVSVIRLTWNTSSEPPRHRGSARVP